MPIPQPQPEEKKQDFMSRCMSFMADDEPSMANEQRVAICMDTFRNKNKKKGESVNKEKKYDNKGRIIIAESVKITFSGTVDFKDE